MVPEKCSFEGCGRKIRSKKYGLCTTHYKQHLRGEPLRRIGKSPNCTIDDCSGPTLNREMCSKHYTRWRKYGDPHYVHSHIDPGCSFPGCGRKHFGLGLCQGHYNQKRKGQHLSKLFSLLTIKERLLRQTEITPTCWNWMGGKSSYGYGVISIDGEMHLCHRLSYKEWAGDLPDDRYIDHKCHNPSCINPAHLRPATPKQNSENLNPNFGRGRSGIRGVSWDSREMRWRSRVTHNGITHFLGYYDDPEEAGEVARKKRLELFTYNVVDRQQ